MSAPAKVQAMEALIEAHAVELKLPSVRRRSSCGAPSGRTRPRAGPRQLLAFGRRYEQIAAPFQWKFTRQDLDRLAHKLDLPAAQAA